MIVEWSDPARDDFFALADYIADDDPKAAIDVLDRIDAAVGRLAEHPRSGRPGRLADTRELVIPSLPYIVVYRIRDGRVYILSVFHAARKWPRLS